ncbi:flagellar hook-length control protein FliK [Aeromonas tecta]|uniref:flagellar hook-length control protein FliK n=1 Tax=Aeromonas tecta TaxID=324617 RepID=UPI00068041EB|nr:flagellar hook-length control protein FliK [Aeromonas tecta]
MGLIQFVGTESLPTPKAGGFTHLSRQPDGQGEQYQSLDLPLDTAHLVEETSTKEPSGDTVEQSPLDVAEQLPAFTHMPPVFVRHEEASRLLAARQQPDIATLSAVTEGVTEEAPSASATLRALSRFERLEADRAPMVAFTEGSKERPVLLTGDVARVLNLSIGQNDKQPLPDKLIANLQSLLGDGSERDPLISDVKAMAGQLPAAPLARTAEYQWAPARLADSPTQWGQQLVDVLKDKVELQVNQSIKQAHIRLDPPELGRLELTVRVEGDRLNVQLNVTNPAVREALIQSMEKLRMSLAPHHAGGVEVNVGQGGEQERGDRWQQDKILAGRRQWQEEFEASDRPGQDWLNTLV